MRRRFVIPLLIAFFLAALAGPIALIAGIERGQAAFGDSETLGVNRLSSATVEVEIGPASVALSGENLAPGDRVVGSIQVVNSGTLPVRYALISEASADPLSSWLTWDVWAGSSAATCGTDQVPDDGLANGLALASADASVVPVLGDVAIGLDPGDRTLDPGAAETLCVAVQLDLGTPDSIQNRRLQQEFVVVAEQHTDETTP